jgi:hypothetical protein
MYFSYNDKVICSKNYLAWLLWQKNLVALFVSSRILITKQNVRICTALSSSLFQSFVYTRTEAILSPKWLKIDKNLYLKWHVLQVVLCQKLTTEYFSNTSILIFDLFLTKFHSFFEVISDPKSYPKIRWYWWTCEKSTSVSDSFIEWSKLMKTFIGS